MNTNPEVDRWLAETKHPLEKSMRRLREIILGADPRMTELVQYRTLHFGYEGDLASFVQLAKKHLTLMFNTGARIPGRFPHLEGDGPNARFMRFADLAEVEARATELARIVTAWCAFKTPASADAKPGTKAKRAPATASAPTQAKSKAKPRARK